MQLAGIAALSPDADAEVASMNELYRRRRDLVCGALAKIGIDIHPPKGTIYVWAPSRRALPVRRPTASTYSSSAAVVISPGSAYGPSGEGWFRISLTTPDERLAEAVQRLGALVG